VVALFGVIDAVVDPLAAKSGPPGVGIDPVLRRPVDSQAVLVGDVRAQSHIAVALNHTFMDVAPSAPLIWPGSSNSPSRAETATGVEVMGPDLSAGTAFPLAVVVATDSECASHGQHQDGDQLAHFFPLTLV